ncbi:MAG TPA: high-affinity branched-chain amino acid ABC transporter permease LivM [Candidatus Competibacteraceae bacterium]|nr:MAG: high-affinity branched-chain amino acid ABC transporter permease LivM [Candidatus Competibacteraceae bacterium]HOB61897.1 high-affinity branched-chain amino acid ABC transporter permease LivM [Candidatus Competibacteraceae bacterium]HQA25338.1 high-affinity branched-chain amino acid ABC transporter permease LivM [Candidatus Competibacteraceae bacterium]HQD55383.1 high-affinity branched-chain amino acid ABC transporter permease LivM [Candidatus Competibacteraceae bacterium]
MPRNLLEAVLVALLAGLLTVPILGIHIQVDGIKVSLQGNAMPVLAIMAVVFAARLFQVPQKAATGMAYLSQRLPRPPRLAASYRPVLIGLVIVVAIVWPFTASRSAIDIATLALIYVMLGLGLNVVVGFAGLLDLGYVAFYAVGAYGYALLSMHWGLSFWACLPLCVLMAAATGCLLGFPVLRLRGDYLAIVTLGFGEIIRLLLNNLNALTGGPDGIGNIAKPTLFGLEFAREPSTEGGVTFHQFFGLDYHSIDTLIFLYLVALGMALLILYVINRLIRMPIGRAWEALREDEIACRSLGLNPTTIKLSAFGFGASTAGFAGAFFAARQGFINPESFTFIESAIVLAIVVLGGMGSQLGVILAAIALTALPEIARQFAEYRMLIFGLVLVLMMIWRPQGLVPASRPRLELPERAETAP